MARRSPRPPSWLSIVESASAAFTGTAHVVDDHGVPATETSFRGPGHAVTAEIEPGDPVFGDIPTTPVQLGGQTELAPDERGDPRGPRFPPDSLRVVPYWDYARVGVEQSVLVVLSEPPAVRAVSGPDDDLLPAIALIRRWTELDEHDVRAQVERDLAEREGVSPVAYVAGFELLLSTTSAVPELAAWFLRRPGRPVPAACGIVDVLYLLAIRLSDDAIKALARQLVEIGRDEDNPEVLAGLLVWFDAHRARTWEDDPQLGVAVHELAARANTTL